MSPGLGRTWLLLFTLATAAPAGAATIVLSTSAEHALEPRPVRLIARPVLASARGGAEPVERVVQAPGRIEWPLAEGVVWQVELSGFGIWAAPAVLAAGDGELRLELWPTGRIGGMLLPPQDSRPPREVRLRFQSSRRLPTALLPAGTVACPVEHTTFTCVVPAAADLDLRVKAERYVSRFFWHRRVAADGDLWLGPVPLVRGASLLGWVVDEGGRPPGPDDRLVVALSPDAPGDPEEAPDGGAGETTKVDAQGFFQFVGVLPGRYVATAKASGGRSAESPALTVVADRDAELIEPLVLRPPLEAVVQVSPPLDPEGGAWRVEVQPAGGSAGRPRTGRTDASGTARLSGLRAGRYLVVVRDTEGRRLHVDEVDLEAGRPHLDVTIDRIPVAGRVLLGDQPLAAQVTLGGRSGAVSLRVRSDDEGRFEAWVPHEGLWRVDVAASEPPVLRRLVDVPIERAAGQRVARVDLRLPDTLLEGEIVDAEGRPVDAATLLVVQVPASEPIVDRRVRSGRFRLRGLAPGTYRLEAVAGPFDRQVRSGSVDVVLDEAAPYAHARLVLAPPLEVAGRVTGAWGAVPGAEIFARPLDQPPQNLGISAVSDFEGRFELRLPAGTTRVDLLVMAPGYALLPLSSVAVQSGRPLSIRVDEAGGDLLLDLDRPLDQWPHPTFESQGGAISSSMLAEWVRRNSAPTGGDVVLIPRLPPGFYRVCRASAAEPMGRRTCDEGVLAIGGVLELSARPAGPSRSE